MVKTLIRPFEDDRGWPKETEYSPIPDYGDVMTIESFIECCRTDGFIDYDGHGHYVLMETKKVGDTIEVVGKMNNLITVYPSNIKAGKIDKRFTHVIWFNK
jgi:hypothetical protein